MSTSFSDLSTSTSFVALYADDSDDSDDAEAKSVKQIGPEGILICLYPTHC